MLVGLEAGFETVVDDGVRPVDSNALLKPLNESSADVLSGLKSAESL